MFASVIVDVKSSNVDIMYTYRIPDELSSYVGIGSRVMVNFGVRKIIGYVVEVMENNPYNGEVKDILEVLDYSSELTSEQVSLARFIKKDTNCLLVSALECMYPGFLKTKYRKFLYCKEPDKLDLDLAIMFNGKQKIAIAMDTFKDNPKLNREIRLGNIEVSYDIYQYGKNKKEKLYRVNPAFEHLIDSLNNKRYEIMMYVRRNDLATSLEIREAVGCSVYMLNALVKEEYLIIKEDYVIREKIDVNKKINKAFSFSFEEKELIEKFTTLSGKPFLLYSNDEDFKLDFYLSEAIKMVSLNKKVMIVAPTLIEAFKVSKYFRRYLEGYKILSFTSDLSNGEYYDKYISVIKKEYDIIITTKVGALLPVSDLGLIIVINEGDFNYLSEYTPKYNLVKVLEERARYFDSKFVITSTSPQIETYYKYTIAKMFLLKHIEKVDRNLTLVDMNKEYGKYPLLSEALINAISATLQNKKQVVLMQNAKGYSNYIVCRNCGEVLRCPKCQIPLTYYKEKDEIKCRYCGRKLESNRCSCGSMQFNYLGSGLSSISEALKELFPNAKVLQMDSDTIKTTADYHEALLQIENQDVDIIIGTRNVLSIFSNEIRLIGLIDIDQFLNGNDYKSSEATYELIDECASHSECKTIVQGHHINNLTLQYALINDYDSFYENELKERRMYLYPPFSEINRLIISGPYKDMYYCANYLKKITVSLIKDNIDVLGPVYQTKLKAVQLLVKHNNIDRILNIIKEVEKKFANNKVTISFERYPRNFG